MGIDNASENSFGDHGGSRQEGFEDHPNRPKDVPSLFLGLSGGSSEEIMRGKGGKMWSPIYSSFCIAEFPHPMPLDLTRNTPECFERFMCFRYIDVRCRLFFAYIS